jgi:hypothetical protein
VLQTLICNAPASVYGWRFTKSVLSCGPMNVVPLAISLACWAKLGHTSALWHQRYLGSVLVPPEGCQRPPGFDSTEGSGSAACHRRHRAFDDEDIDVSAGDYDACVQRVKGRWVVAGS